MRCQIDRRRQILLDLQTPSCAACWGAGVHSQRYPTHNFIGKPKPTSTTHNSPFQQMTLKMTTTNSPVSSPVTIRQAFCDKQTPPGQNRNSSTSDVFFKIYLSTHVREIAQSPVIEAPIDILEKECYNSAASDSFDPNDAIGQTTQAAASRPSFQQRGRFLIWPAEHNTTFASSS